MMEESVTAVTEKEAFTIEAEYANGENITILTDGPFAAAGFVSDFIFNDETGPTKVIITPQA